MQFIKRLKPMTLPQQNSTANTFYVDTDDESIKVGTGASGSTERTLLDSLSGASFPGSIIPTTTNLYDLGSTSKLWKSLNVVAVGVNATPGATGSITASGNIFAGTSNSFVWSGRSAISSSADGIIELFNGATTGFTRLNFGGTTASFPSVARSGGNLAFKQADDSAFSAVYAASYNFGAVGGIGANGDGIFQLYNTAGTNFNRLQFGGTTSSFPALKRSTTQILCRLADDSGDAGLGCSGLAASGTVQSANTTATPVGGTVGVSVTVGSALVGFYIGTGAPSVTAPKGSIYTNTTATTTTTRLYVNTDGGTTWTNLTTAA